MNRSKFSIATGIRASLLVLLPWISVAASRDNRQYQNKKYGFEFDYPAGWVESSVEKSQSLNTGTTAMFQVNFSPPDHKVFGPSGEKVLISVRVIPIEKTVLHLSGGGCCDLHYAPEPNVFRPIPKVPGNGIDDYIGKRFPDDTACAEEIDFGYLGSNSSQMTEGRYRTHVILTDHGYSLEVYNFNIGAHDFDEMTTMLSSSFHLINGVNAVKASCTLPK